MLTDYSLGAFILLGVIILFGVVVTSLLCFFLLVMHEYGHVAAMMRYGIKTEYVVIGWPTVARVRIGGLQHHIGLIPLFGYAYSTELMKVSPRARLMIALAGPLASLLLGLFLFGVLSVTPDNWLLSMAAWGSLALAGLNIVPLPPMDGWHVVKYLLARRGGAVSEEMEHNLFVAGIAFVWLTVLVASSLDVAA